MLFVVLFDRLFCKGMANPQRVLFFFLMVVGFLGACTSSVAPFSQPATTQPVASQLHIAVQPFGDFDAVLTDSMQATIERVYNCKVSVLPSMPLPESAFINVKSPRYRADTIIAFLRRTIPDSFDHVIGLTHKDISTTKKDASGKMKEPAYKYADWGILGLGYRPGQSCVVSTFRMKATSKAKEIDRFKKVCMHELGHNFGLPHCTADATCVMRDAAETVKTVDEVKLKLCASCSR